MIPPSKRETFRIQVGFMSIMINDHTLLWSYNVWVDESHDQPFWKKKSSEIQVKIMNSMICEFGKFVTISFASEWWIWSVFWRTSFRIQDKVMSTAQWFHISKTTLLTHLIQQGQWASWSLVTQRISKKVVEVVNILNHKYVKALTTQPVLMIQYIRCSAHGDHV